MVSPFLKSTVRGALSKRAHRSSTSPPHPFSLSAASHGRPSLPHLHLPLPLLLRPLPPHLIHPAPLKTCRLPHRRRRRRRLLRPPLPPPPPLLPPPPPPPPPRPPLSLPLHRLPLPPLPPSPLHLPPVLRRPPPLPPPLLLLALSLLLPHPLPPDLLHLLSALAFALLSAASAHSSFPASDLQSKSSSISSLISAASASLSLTLALVPSLFIADLALAASLALQGLWSLQTGLSLYVDSFIPDGCHRLIDAPNASTRCDVEDSRIRAAALLDLAFVLHATFAAVVAIVVYMVIARSAGGLVRRGSYEALATSSSTGALADLEHVQMKATLKNSMQA